MARIVWQGGVDTAYATAGNWVGGSAPSAGDDVVIAPHPTTGVSNAIAGSNQTATELASFTVHPGYSANIGSSGTYLQIDADEFRIHGSSEELWLDASNASGAIDWLTVSSTGQSVASNRTTKGVHIDLSSNVTELALNAGLCILESNSSGTVTRCAIQGATAFLDHHVAVLYHESGTTEIDSDSNLTTLWMSDGTVIVHDGGFSEVRIFRGTVDWRSPDGITTRLEVHGTGKWTNINNTHIPTINAAWVLGNGTIDLRNGADDPVFTSPIERRSSSSSILADDLRTITIAKV